MTPSSRPARLILWFLTLLPAAAVAQDAKPVEIESVGGAMKFHAADGVWAQRIITVVNHSDANREVKVIFATAVPGRGQTQFTRVFDVPARCSRKAELAICPGLIDPAEGQGGGSGSRKMFEQTFALQEAGGGSQKLDQLSLPIYRVSGDARVVAVVAGQTDSGEEFAYLRQSESVDDANAPTASMPATSQPALKSLKAAKPTPKPAAKPRKQPGPLGEIELVGLTDVSGSLTSLPSRWYGYSMVRVLLLTDVDTAALPVSQREAIFDWVRRGGVLMLAGGKTLAATLAGELSQDAGVTATGFHYVSRMNVSEPNAPAQTVSLRWPLPMAELVPLEADVLATCNGLPLLTRRRLGQGVVFSLAMPVAALADEAVRGLWRAVRQAADEQRPILCDNFIRNAQGDHDAGVLAASLQERCDRLPPAGREACLAIQDDVRAFQSPGRMTLGSIAGRRGPTRATAVGILLALAAAVVVAGVLLRVRRRGELLWLALAPTAVLGCIVLYAAGRAGSDNERLSFVSLVSSIGNGQVRVQEAYGYYSGPSERRLTLSAREPQAVIASLEQSASTALSLSEVATGATMALPDQVVPPNYTKAFSIDAVKTMPALSPSLTFDATGLAGTVRNDLGFTLGDCIVLASRRTYRLGPLAAGTTPVSVPPSARLGTVQYVHLQEAIGAMGNATRSAGDVMATPIAKPLPGLPSATWVNFGRGDFTASPLRGPVEILRNRLLGQLVSVAGAGKTVDDGPVLIGYGNRSVLDPLGGRVVERQGLTVVVWPLQIAAPAAGTAVQAPSGLATVKLQGGAPSLYGAAAQRFNAISHKAAMTVKVQPPWPGGFSQATATLTMQTQAKDFRLRVLGIEAGSNANRAVPVASVDRPGGSTVVTVEQAQRFAGVDGSLNFIVRFESMDEPPPPPSAENVFTDIDVDLEGITK